VGAAAGSGCMVFGVEVESGEVEEWEIMSDGRICSMGGSAVLERSLTGWARTGREVEKDCCMRLEVGALVRSVIVLCRQALKNVDAGFILILV